MTEISWQQFADVEMRLGRILEVEDFPQARKPAYKLHISFGSELGTRRSSAQVTNYTKAELVGKQVVCVMNFPVKKIAGFPSEVLVLGVDRPEGGISLLTSDLEVPDGLKVY